MSIFIYKSIFVHNSAAKQHYKAKRQHNERALRGDQNANIQYVKISKFRPLGVCCRAIDEEKGVMEASGVVCSQSRRKPRQQPRFLCDCSLRSAK